MNLQIYLVTSNVSSTPLAEIRTDGNVFEVTADNTEGKLQELAGKDFKRLQSIIKQSSHLRLERPKVNMPNLLRYIMSNGDIVEITTDGKTCMLNGKLLSAEEQQELFSAIQSGELQVARKADHEQPIPVIPMPHSGQPQQPVPVEAPKLNMGLVNQIREDQEKKQKEADRQTHYHDSSIEKADYSEVSDSAFTKQLAYCLKYGLAKGENPNE